MHVVRVRAVMYLRLVIDEFESTMGHIHLHLIPG